VNVVRQGRNSGPREGDCEQRNLAKKKSALTRRRKIASYRDGDARKKKKTPEVRA